MKRTAPAFRFDINGFSFMGNITCECVGEWISSKGSVKSWVPVDGFDGYQFSLARDFNSKKFYFVLESID